MKSILFIVSEVGYTWEEVIAPFEEFVKAGVEVLFATPLGKIPQVDPLSIKVRPFLNLLGLGISEKYSIDSSLGKKLLEELKKPIPLNQIKTGDFAAIYVSGGHGALFDLNKNKDLHQLILKFDKEKKPVSLLCHASSTLAFMEKEGQPFLKGRRVTGFPTLWEYLALLFHYIHPKFLPLPFFTGKLLDKLATGRTLSDKILEVIDVTFTIQDGNLITGVGPKTGRNLAKKMLLLLK